jgi:hypothetical protein
VESIGRSDILVKHDLVGKPASTRPDHALAEIGWWLRQNKRRSSQNAKTRCKKRKAEKRKAKTKGRTFGVLPFAPCAGFRDRRRRSRA